MQAYRRVNVRFPSQSNQTLVEIERGYLPCSREFVEKVQNLERKERSGFLKGCWHPAGLKERDSRGVACSAAPTHTDIHGVNAVGMKDDDSLVCEMRACGALLSRVRADDDPMTEGR
jgi:hypothetical protein